MALGLYASQAVYYIFSEKSRRVTRQVGGGKKGSMAILHGSRAI